MSNAAILKILFLDIDGVLNSERTRQALQGYPHDFTPDGLAKFDPVAIALIARLCRQTDAQIVLSSSWRIGFSVEECAAGLDLPIIDSTPNFWDEAGICRGDEIGAWLKAHPEVTHYAIVDDCEAMLEEQQPHFVKTDPDNGLSYRDFKQLQTILEISIQELEMA